MTVHLPCLFGDITEDFVPLQVVTSLSFQCVLRPVLDKIHLTAIQDPRVTTTNNSIMDI